MHRLSIVLLALPLLSACGEDRQGGVECDPGELQVGLGCVADPCLGVTCGAGTCTVAGLGTATPTALCVCAAGHAPSPDGLTCVALPDGCADIDCDGHGTCAISGAVPLCVCDEGWVPTATLGCEPAPTTAPCEPNPCVEPLRTTCTASGATAICSCDEGAVPDADNRCVLPPEDPCDPSPCTRPHESVCVVAGAAARCECDPGYVPGDVGCVAEVDDPCNPNPCTLTGQRACEGTAEGGYRCLCSDGYRDEGGVCRLPDPCAPNPCSEPHRGVCVASEGEAVCACDEGYEESGASCVPVDPCDPNPCTTAHRGVCSRGANDTAICSCDEGYVDDGGACVPADPCSPNPCTTPHRTVCEASGGVATCACEPGWVDDGGVCVAEVLPGCGPARPTGDAYENDDCAADATDVDARAGTTQSHTIDVKGDLDWYRATCGARDTLTVTVAGLDTVQTFYAADGTTVLSSSDSQTVRYRCPSAATIFIRVRHFSSTDTGAYSATFGLRPDDFGDLPATATAIPFGTSTTFDLEGPGDLDTFAFDAELTHTYEVRVTNADTRTAVYDPQLVELFDTDSQTRRFEAAAAGEHVVELRVFSSGTWAEDLGLVVADLGADDHPDAFGPTATSVATDASATALALAAPGERDAFRFACAAGNTYEVVVSGADTRTEVFDANGQRLIDTDSQTTRFRASATGTCGLQLRLFDSASWVDTVTLRVRDLGPDDHGDAIATAAVVSADGQPFAHALAFAGDVDAFRLPVLAHHAYRLAVDGADTRTRLYDAAGQQVLDTDSQTTYFMPELDGTWAFTVRLFDPSAWDDTVTVTVTDLGLDSHGWSPATATPISLDGASLSGAFEVGGDLDWFTFTAGAGHILRLTATGGSFGYTLYGADGVTTVATLTANTSFHELAAAGTYYLRLREDDSSRLAYTLSVTDLGVDDVGDTSTDPGALTVDAAATNATIEQPGDVDVFAVTLGGSEAYAVETTGLSTKVTIYAANGTKVGESTNATTLFTSGAAGVHHVHVRHATTSGYGSYTVRVRR